MSATNASSRPSPRAPAEPRLLGRALAAVIVAASGLSVCTAQARAADETSACVASYERAQVMRRDHRLGRARDELRSCARAACPSLVRSDCITWLDQVQTAFPSLAIRAVKDGSDVATVQVVEDGEVVATHLDGTSLEVEPGEHSFRFETDGAPPVAMTIVVREREKDRVVPVAFVSPHHASAAGASGDRATSHPVPLGVWVLGGVGLAGMATFAVVGSMGKSDEKLTAAIVLAELLGRIHRQGPHRIHRRRRGARRGRGGARRRRGLVPAAAGEDRGDPRPAGRHRHRSQPQRCGARVQRKVLTMHVTTRVTMFVFLALLAGAGPSGCLWSGLDALGAGVGDAAPSEDAAAVDASTPGTDSAAGTDTSTTPMVDSSTPFVDSAAPSLSDAEAGGAGHAEAGTISPPEALPNYLDAGTASWCDQHPGYAFCADFDETALPAGFSASDGAFLIQTSSLPSSGPNDLLLLVPSQSVSGTWGSKLSRPFSTPATSVVLAFDFYPELVPTGGLLFAALDFLGNASAKYSVRLAFSNGAPRLEESYLGSPADVYHSNFSIPAQTWSRVQMEALTAAAGRWRDRRRDGHRERLRQRRPARDGRDAHTSPGIRCAPESPGRRGLRHEPDGRVGASIRQRHARHPLRHPTLPTSSLARAGLRVATLALVAGCSSPASSRPPSDSGADSPTADGPASPPTDAAHDAAADPDGDARMDAPAPAVDAGGPVDGGRDASTTASYVNPVINQDFPDPFVLRQGSTYYAFATNAAGKNVQSARSSDLAHWMLLPDALPTLPAWAASNASLTWAPSVLQRGPSSFVMYYTARDTASGFQCISHAEATAPGGPYVDATTSPFVCQVSGAQSLCGSIDPSPFVDVDGTAYLVWKSDENAAACSRPPRLWSAPLRADGLSLNGPPTQLLTMDQPWQQPIIEGPSMTVIGGTYYLLYSANAYESAAYSMGYATCLSAIGPCENASVGGPFISSAGPALGPGGGEFFDDPQGGRWLVYHAWTAPQTTYSGGGARSMRIDRLGVDAGALTFAGPSTSAQLL